jgi:hypothetical protein
VEHLLSKTLIPWLYTDLFGYLTKVVDKADDGVAFQRVGYAVDVDVTLVEEIVEHVTSIDGRLPLLLITEYQINPLVEVCADVIAFKSLSVNANKLSSVTFSPRR